MRGKYLVYEVEVLKIKSAERARSAKPPSSLHYLLYDSPLDLKLRTDLGAMGMT